MARFRGLRGRFIDPFGRSLEREMERQLADDYDATLRRALHAMNPGNAWEVENLASLHERIRGYGHVKLANLAMVKRRERELSAKLEIDAQTGKHVRASMDEMKGAAGLKGIPVVVAR